MQIGLPITGKYRDSDSDQYYNNNNVRKQNYVEGRRLIIKTELDYRVQKFYKHRISIMNMFWDIKLLFCALQKVTCYN